MFCQNVTAVLCTDNLLWLPGATHSEGQERFSHYLRLWYIYKKMWIKVIKSTFTSPTKIQNKWSVSNLLPRPPYPPMETWRVLSVLLAAGRCVQCIYTEHGNTGSLCAFFTEIGFLISRVLQFLHQYFIDIHTLYTFSALKGSTCVFNLKKMWCNGGFKDLFLC